MADTTERPERHAPLTLRAEKCTAYMRGAFGFRRHELREISVRVGSFAQHVAAVHVTWIEKGRRSRVGVVLSDRDGVGLVVLGGHGHPVPRDAMTEGVEVSHGPGVSVRTSQTRWSCYAPEWSEEFDRTFADYFATHEVLADYRSHDVSGGARFLQLRAGAPLTAGDRVATSQGPGRIEKVQRAANGRDAARFQVLFDAAPVDARAGRLEWLPAAECRWEGAPELRQVAP